MENTKRDLGPNIEIRHFQMNDLDNLAKSLTKNSDHIAEYLPDGKIYKAFTIYEYRVLIREYVKNLDPYEYFGAFYRGELIGTGVMCPGSSQFGVQLIYWVDKDYQHQGVASKMVNTISEHCFKEGYWNIEVQTDKSNLGSQRVLQKNGFVMMDEYKFHPAGTKDTGDMLVWFRFNPYTRSPFGPKRNIRSLWNRTMILPR
jgi:RimJ/RimL family protein N-acetyltransferase